FLSRVLAKLSMAQRDYTTCFNGLEAYAGQAYWTLSRAACRYITEFVARNRLIVSYFRNTFTADEMFFHTILGNSPFAPRIRKSLLFVEPDWSIRNEGRHKVNGEHIRFFESQDKVWTVDEWGAGEMLFARKFSDDNLALVERIDAMIDRKE